MTKAQETNKIEFEKVSHEIMRFMRGKYAFDEVAEGNKLKFMYKETIVLTMTLDKGKYDFEIVLSKDSCNEKKSIHMVRSIEDFNSIKLLIESKFKPNRKPFLKKNAIYGKCGHRCDLCIHYTDMDEELRSKITANLTHVYDHSSWNMRCSGCGKHDCHGVDGKCKQLKCVYEKNYEACVKCDIYPCNKATVGYQKLEPRSISAEDVTWGILPYVPYQYGN